MKTQLPVAGRVVRGLVGVAMLSVAGYILAIGCRNLSRGSVDVQPSWRSGGDVAHLRGWTTYLFSAGQLVLAVALLSGGLAMLIACCTGSDRHPATRRLLVAGGISLAIAVLLCTVPVFVKRYL